jgi:hypothetical protein
MHLSLVITVSLELVRSDAGNASEHHSADKSSNFTFKFLPVLPVSCVMGVGGDSLVDLLYVANLSFSDIIVSSTRSEFSSFY